MNKKTGTNEQELDILTINNKISKYFIKEKEKQEEYTTLLSTLCNLCLSSTIPYGVSQDDISYLKKKQSAPLGDSSDGKRKRTKTFTLTEFNDLVYFIRYVEDYVSSIQVNELTYFCLTTNLISQYKELLKETTTVSFLGSQTKKENHKLKQCIQQYKDAVKQFIYKYFKTYTQTLPKINIIKKDIIGDIFTINTIFEPATIKKQKRKIQYCKCYNPNNAIEDSSGKMICGECGLIYHDIDSDQKSCSYQDFSRVNFGSNFKYERKSHFRDTINQYQSKQNRYIPEKVYNDLNLMLENHGLKVKGETERIKIYPNVTKDHIRMFLKETKHTKYYEDLHLIYSSITGRPKVDISKQEKQLYEDFEALLETYEKIKEQMKLDRNNFLHSHYILRQLLLRQGIKVPESDLNLLKTHSRLRKHDEIYHRCCEALGWNFVPLS